MEYQINKILIVSLIRQYKGCKIGVISSNSIYYIEKPGPGIPLGVNALITIKLSGSLGGPLGMPL